MWWSLFLNTLLIFFRVMMKICKRYAWSRWVESLELTVDAYVVFLSWIWTSLIRKLRHLLKWIGGTFIVFKKLEDLLLMRVFLYNSVFAFFGWVSVIFFLYFVIRLLLLVFHTLSWFFFFFFFLRLWMRVILCVLCFLCIMNYFYIQTFKKIRYVLYSIYLFFYWKKKKKYIGWAKRVNLELGVEKNELARPRARYPSYMTLIKAWARGYTKHGKPELSFFVHAWFVLHPPCTPHSWPCVWRLPRSQSPLV